MKIVWKNKGKGESGKKRARTELPALNPNLPFEREEEKEEFDDKKRINTEISSSNDQDQKKMAESLESQGNQLAEVQSLKILIEFQ